MAARIAEELKVELGSLVGYKVRFNDRVRADTFDVNLIPHILKVTTLKRLARGVKVNLEIDLLARYLERLRAAKGIGRS